jgi:hypothetical protein
MVCQWFGLKTTGMVFSGLTSKPVVMDFSGLASKLVATIFSGLLSKPVVSVSPGLASKNGVGFLCSGSKPMWWRVSRFGPQNRQQRLGGQTGENHLSGIETKPLTTRPSGFEARPLTTVQVVLRPNH